MVISEQDKRIEELTAELENASQRSEAYRASLLAVLKDMEEEKLKIAVKVQNTRLNLKGLLLEGGNPLNKDPHSSCCVSSDRLLLSSDLSAYYMETVVAADKENKRAILE
ncbi:hypothetical protein VitviT2T_024755 [Vitis vinifera]|uniref:Uncharacterized protein n=1 Tax=Vitis vinifera TaxID=29760 RepID=A0ABY9DHC2_VITVI|nr:hypothetical protein VitviT2T_024755 [Vitis vinifera]